MMRRGGGGRNRQVDVTSVAGGLTFTTFCVKSLWNRLRNFCRYQQLYTLLLCHFAKLCLFFWTLSKLVFSVWTLGILCSARPVLSHSKSSQSNNLYCFVQFLQHHKQYRLPAIVTFHYYKVYGS